MTNKSTRVLSEISPGELLDKISILEIKLEKVKDKDRQKRIKNEYDILKKVQNSSIEMSDKIKDLYRSVSNVNIKLWDIEDKIRICEQNKDFGKNFIELARGVYFNNDKRAELKNEINEILKSNIREIKQFVDYFKI
jgi:adenine C2-methylase RlmN of 23S rRNA A2503 and tRNA A37|tara:strand:- start:362 stop:772 length:411 start_codon:yes stop_codon:yes gene_type:complete